jgi:predicted anti-sigma-YlaC factor YlaD
LALALLSSGCSIRKLAIGKVGDALASGGTTFAADDDPELIRSAAPFSLKLMESLLAEVPRHEGLLLASASGFTQYAYAFVQLEADALRAEDLERSRELLARARKLYLRARDYGLRGLEGEHRGFTARLQSNPRQAVGAATRADVPLLYWTAAAWVAAIATDKTDARMVSDLPRVDALLERALILDEAYDQGALQTLMITYEMARQGVEGDPAERARRRFARALELSGGAQAAPYVSYAEAVCVVTENRAEFLAALDKALAIDADAEPRWRLSNTILQRRARWLKQRVDDLFLPPIE